MPHDHRRAAELLRSALREAGELALKTFRGNIRSWTKGHDSPVSEADIAVDGLLRQRLAHPGYGWLSEETHDDRARLNESSTWIVDPIDGTRAYLAGKSDWSICAALIEDGRPVVGGVYAPVDDEMFLATAGQGATRNGQPIRATHGDELAGAHVAGPERYLKRLSSGSTMTAVPKIHSLALRLTRVAEGRIDAAMASFNAHDWDLAAADLLVHEADGALTDLAGDRLVYNLHNPVHGAVVAAGRARHAAMLELIRHNRKDFG